MNDTIDKTNTNIDEVDMDDIEYPEGSYCPIVLVVSDGPSGKTYKFCSSTPAMVFRFSYLLVFLISMMVVVFVFYIMITFFPNNIIAIIIALLSPVYGSAIVTMMCLKKNPKWVRE